MTSPDPGRQELATKLAPIRQEHLLAFWDGLSEGERERLARQIDEIDVELFQELQAEHRAAAGKNESSKWAELAAQAEPPPAMRLDGSGVRFSREAARAAGSHVERGFESYAQAWGESVIAGPLPPKP